MIKNIRDSLAAIDGLMIALARAGDEGITNGNLRAQFPDLSDFEFDSAIKIISREPQAGVVLKDGKLLLTDLGKRVVAHIRLKLN